MEKLPPLQKVYEAWSAPADGRVETGDQGGVGDLSNGAKRYTVTTGWRRLCLQ